MNEKKIVPKNDYEIYTMQMPLSVLLKGKKRSFIYSELEKRHPCFSDDWSFDSKMRFSKQGIETDVLVMNKLKLSEYQNNRKKKLLFESGEKRAFGSSKNEIVLCVIGCLILICFMLTAFFVGFAREKSTLSKKSYENNENVSKVIEDYGFRSDSINSLLNDLERSGGRFDGFVWETDGRKEYFSTIVKYIYPEVLTTKDISNCLIRYENENPFFEIVVDDWLSEKKLLREEILSKKEFISLMRNCMAEFSVLPIEENYEKLSFKFSCDEYKEINGENFFLDLCQLCSKTGYVVEKIQLKKLVGNNKADGFSGELIFGLAVDYKNGIDLEKFAWRTNLLIDKKDFKTDLKKTSSINSSKSMCTVPGQKLGEIKHSDGTTSVFYKDSKGKIICVD